jgi:hypothetical protein
VIASGLDALMPAGPLGEFHSECVRPVNHRFVGHIVEAVMGELDAHQAAVNRAVEFVAITGIDAGFGLPVTASIR